MVPRFVLVHGHRDESDLPWVILSRRDCEDRGAGPASLEPPEEPSLACESFRVTKSATLQWTRPTTFRGFGGRLGCVEGGHVIAHGCERSEGYGAGAKGSRDAARSTQHAARSRDLERVDASGNQARLGETTEPLVAVVLYIPSQGRERYTQN